MRLRCAKKRANFWATCTQPKGTKLYNLVAVEGRWCFEAGKVTAGLASHWSCVTDTVVSTTYGHIIREMQWWQWTHWHNTPPCWRYDSGTL